MSKRWVLKCKECRSEFIYAEIPTAKLSTYFLPKKPAVPTNFTYVCPACGHKDSYTRADLLYQDDEIGHEKASPERS
jgi:Zn finger protein HypA/HybF involved in hydrogenase expression